MDPVEIMKMLKDKIDKNVAGELDNPPELDERGKVVRLNGGGLFYEFEWMPDTVEAHLKQQQKENEESKHKIEDLHGAQAFKVTTNPNTNNHQNPFNADGKETVMPYFSSADDPYEAAKDDLL